MVGALNNDYYCTANKCWLPEGESKCVGLHLKNCDCGYKHLKYPPPKEFVHEYDREWKGAVYFNAWHKTGKKDSIFKDGEWQILSLTGAILIASHEENLNPGDFDFSIICACTPFGAPPVNWRPPIIKSKREALKEARNGKNG